MIAGAIITVCFGIPLTVFAGALAYPSFERFVARKWAEHEGFRPIELRDDMLGDLPNVPRLAIPECVDALHRSGDRT